MLDEDEGEEGEGELLSCLRDDGAVVYFDVGDGGGEWKRDNDERWGL